MPILVLVLGGDAACWTNSCCLLNKTQKYTPSRRANKNFKAIVDTSSIKSYSIYHRFRGSYLTACWKSSIRSQLTKTSLPFFGACLFWLRFNSSNIVVVWKYPQTTGRVKSCFWLSQWAGLHDKISAALALSFFYHCFVKTFTPWFSEATEHYISLRPWAWYVSVFYIVTINSLF